MDPKVKKRKTSTEEIYKKKKTAVFKRAAPKKLQRKIIPCQDYIDGKICFK